MVQRNWISETLLMLADKHPTYTNEFPYDYDFNRVLFITAVSAGLGHKAKLRLAFSIGTASAGPRVQALPLAVARLNKAVSVFSWFGGLV